MYHELLTCTFVGFFCLFGFGMDLFHLFLQHRLWIQLGLYLLTREKRSPEYKKILYGPDAAKKKPLPVVIVVWTFCALLYARDIGWPSS